MKKNIVININLKGGLIGFFSSPKNVIKNILENYNNQGYYFVYSLPPNPNPLFFIVQWLCFICTFGIYCPLPSYMMILEKDIEFKDLEQIKHKTEPEIEERYENGKIVKYWKDGDAPKAGL